MKVVTTLNAAYYFPEVFLFFNTVLQHTDIFVPSCHKFENSTVLDIGFVPLQLLIKSNFHYFVAVKMGRDNVDSIATRYGLDGPVIEFQWGQGFLHPSIPLLGPTHPSIQWVPGVLPGVKRQGRGANHPPPSIHSFIIHS